MKLKVIIAIVIVVLNSSVDSNEISKDFSHKDNISRLTKMLMLRIQMSTKLSVLSKVDELSNINVKFDNADFTAKQLIDIISDDFYKLIEIEDELQNNLNAVLLAQDGLNEHNQVKKSLIKKNIFDYFFQMNKKPYTNEYQSAPVVRYG
jgi:hypothetical protein